MDEVFGDGAACVTRTRGSRITKEKNWQSVQWLVFGGGMRQRAKVECLDFMEFVTLAPQSSIPSTGPNSSNGNRSIAVLQSAKGALAGASHRVD
jgi:hypothetical protein